MRMNRVTVPDGIHHICARVCDGAMKFQDEEVKEFVMNWIFNVASFSGVDVRGWCIMDNHLHIMVHIPGVPDCYWLDPDVEPVCWTFGMRPPECSPQLWSADGAAVPTIASRRPPLGFMLPDDDMLERLVYLYGEKAVEEIAKQWKNLRRHGKDDIVDAEKERYCRRMYNLSQFSKTLMETIARNYNAKFQHKGRLWQSRFFSNVIENRREVLAVVAGYIAYNPVKAKLVGRAEMWRYSSYAAAVNDQSNLGERCRMMYAKLFNCDWETARKIMDGVLDDRLPDGITDEMIAEYCRRYANDNRSDEQIADERKRADEKRGKVPDAAVSLSASVSLSETEAGDSYEDSEEWARIQKIMSNLRASQVIHSGLKLFGSGAYIGSTIAFAKKAVSHIAFGYRRHGFRSVRKCRAFRWTLPALAA